MSELIFIYDSKGVTDSANVLARVRKGYETGRLLVLSTAKDQICNIKDVTSYDAVFVEGAHKCTKSDIIFLKETIESTGIDAVCYGLRTDFKGELYEGAMWLFAWADVIVEASAKATEAMAKAEPVTEPVEESLEDLEEEPVVSERLLDFLDAATYVDKLEIVKRHGESLDDWSVNAMAASLDIEIDEKPLEDRIADLISCLETMMKYETNRLR